MRTVGISGNCMVLTQGAPDSYTLTGLMIECFFEASIIRIPDRYDSLEVKLFDTHISVGDRFYNVERICELDYTQEFLFVEEGNDYFVLLQEGLEVAMSQVKCEDRVFAKGEHVSEYEEYFGDRDVKFVSCRDILNAGYTKSRLFLVNNDLIVIGESDKMWKDKSITCLASVITINNGVNGCPLLLDVRYDGYIYMMTSDGSLVIINFYASNDNQDLLYLADEKDNINIEVFRSVDPQYVSGIGVLGDNENQDIHDILLAVLDGEGLSWYTHGPNSTTTDPVIEEPIVLDTTYVVKSDVTMKRTPPI